MVASWVRSERRHATRTRNGIGLLRGDLGHRRRPPGRRLAPERPDHGADLLGRHGRAESRGEPAGLRGGPRARAGRAHGGRWYLGARGRCQGRATDASARPSRGLGTRRPAGIIGRRALTTTHTDPDHRIEMRVVHGLATALLGAGLGVQVFLSFLVAPAAFRVVDRPVAARVMEGVFPGYYGFGLTTIAMALALVLVLALREPGAAPLGHGGAARADPGRHGVRGARAPPGGPCGSPPRPGGAGRGPRPPRVLAAPPAGRGRQHHHLPHGAHRPGAPPRNGRGRPSRAGAARVGLSSGLGENLGQPIVKTILLTA